MSTFQQRLSDVVEKMETACERSARPFDSVKLVTVSKTWPAERLQEAYEAGIRVFGENKVQEIEEKAPGLPDDCCWHLIGHLQKNKARKLISSAGNRLLVETIDSPEIAYRIDRIAREEHCSVEGLIQVNISSDSAKYGVSPEEVEALLQDLGNLSNLSIRGLMTITENYSSQDDTRRDFAKMRKLYDSLATSGHRMDELSMGMSADYPIAIEEGATLVRVGSALFGPRDRK